MYKIIVGHALDELRTLEANSVRCVVTSPPYYHLRDYGISPTWWPEVTYAPMAGLSPITCAAGEYVLGLEPSVDMYIAHLVAVFREVRRVMTDDGVLWINIDDSYAGSGKGRFADGRSAHVGALQYGNVGSRAGYLLKTPTPVPAKNLLGVPQRLALALQADGWYWRCDVVWHKPNGFVESVKDRPTRNHEYVLMLTKSPRYYYDRDAILEPYVAPINRWGGERLVARGSSQWDRGTGQSTYRNRSMRPNQAGRNRRSVWAINTRPSGVPHYATFPPDLPRLCIRATSAVGDTVLDPFAGVATTGVVALEEGRNFIGIEISPEYARIARERLDAYLWAQGGD